MLKTSRLTLAILTIFAVAGSACAQAVPAQTIEIRGTADVSSITARLDSLEQQALEHTAERPAESFVGPTVTEAAQTTIPRYADGKSPPAGRIQNQVYRATSETQRQKVPAVLVTEDCDQQLSAYTSLTPGRLPAVQQPILRDVAISGVPGEVNDRFEFNTGKPTKYGGIIFNASGGVVDNLHVFGVPGLAGYFNRSGYTGKAGPSQLWDRTELLLTNLNANGCFAGYEIAGTDMQIRGCIVSGWRGDAGEFGIKVSGNANQCSDFHAWGGNGPGIWITGQGNKLTNIESESDPIGLLLDGGTSTIFGYRCFRCWECCLRVNGTQNELRGLDLAAEKVAVELNNQHNTLQGRVGCSDGGTCVVLNNAVAQQIDLSLGMYGRQEARGLVATTGQVSCCDIKLLVSGGAVGADFSAGLGVRNRIRVTTKDGTKTPILLPKKWDASNEITVNGVRQ